MPSLLNKFTDTLGITDSGRNQRTLDALRAGQTGANSQLDADISAQLGMLSQAGTGRSFGENLDRYGAASGQAGSQLQKAAELAGSQAGAGSTQDIMQRMNPMKDAMLDATAQRVQGGAGSALQSSAANRTMATALGQQAGNLWEQAFKDSLSQAQSNLGTAQAMGGLGEMQGRLAAQNLEAENAPMEDWIQLKNDLAMQRYAGNLGLTQAEGVAAGADRSLLGQLFGQNPGGQIISALK